jgi:TonB family protein
MRAVLFSSLFLFAIAAGARIPLRAQDTAQTKPEAKPDPVRVYHVGGEVTAPVLHVADFSEAVSSGCGTKRETGSVSLQAVIDEQGIPRNISFIRFSGEGLDYLAVRIAALDRFTPATKDGVPVPVGEEIELKLEDCLETGTTGPTASSPHLALAGIPSQKVTSFNNVPGKVIFAQDTASSVSPAIERASASTASGPPSGTYRVGPGISAPVLLNSPLAEYSAEARQKGIRGEVMVSLIVDIHGLPRRLRVVLPLGAGLDEKALEAVTNYRFRPAIRDGVEPVPVMVTVAINFR